MTCESDIYPPLTGSRTQRKLFPHLPRFLPSSLLIVDQNIDQPQIFDLAKSRRFGSTTRPSFDMSAPEQQQHPAVASIIQQQHPSQQPQQQQQQPQQSSPVHAPSPTSSGVDSLTCQWANCGERCSAPEQLYVSSWRIALRGSVLLQRSSF